MKSLVIASLIVIFVVGGIAMFLTIPNQVDFQKSAESAVCVPPEIAEKLNEDRSYAMTLKDFDFITVAECVAKNLVINNLDEKYSIVGEVTSVFVVVAESLPPHISVAVILSLKDNTNLSSDNIVQYRILVGVSQVNMVNLNSIKAEIRNNDQGWQETQSPLKDNIESKQSTINSENEIIPHRYFSGEDWAIEYEYVHTSFPIEQVEKTISVKSISNEKFKILNIETVSDYNNRFAELPFAPPLQNTDINYTHVIRIGGLWTNHRDLIQETFENIQGIKNVGMFSAWEN